MEIKKGTKWTCIEDVIIGYNLRIFNASEVYESPSDNHLTDNSGKVRYVSSAWHENFVFIPAGKRSATQNSFEDNNTIPPHKKADLEESLEKWVDKVAGGAITGVFVDVPKLSIKEVESAITLEALNTAEKRSRESEAKEWQKYCEQYESKRGYKLGDTEMVGVGCMNSEGKWETHPYEGNNLKEKQDWWDSIYDGKEGVGYLPKPCKIIKYEPEEKTGVKNDSEKLPYYTVLFKQFPLALKEVIKCSKAGKIKYDDQDMQNFSRVENAETRYKDAMLRHMAESGQVEDMIQFGEITHEAAVVWNALADLEVKLRKNNLV